MMKTLPESMKTLGVYRRLQREELLFAAQDRAEGFYYVESGEIRVFRMDEQGKEVEVVRLEEGDFLGEAVVFVSSAFPFYAQAAKESALFYFDKKKILQKIDEDPAIARFFIQLLAHKCTVLNARIESLGIRTVRQRLAQYLLSRCSRERECTVELNVKKGELAKILGTISETLSRNLKQMQEEGIIAVSGSRITILDCAALRQELTC
jgi:CRP-like cAMP-binding protein